MFKEGVCKFSEKILIFKGPCEFLKMKTLPHARTAEIADFLELNSQKYTWSQVKCKFQNSKTSAKSLHPYSTGYSV